MGVGKQGRDVWASVGLLILRVGAGGLLLYGHGWPKLARFAERSATFADPIGLGPAPSFALVVFTEVLCATLVIVGAATRIAAVPPVLFFLIAAFIHHAPDPWPKKELALIYLVPFLALLFTGGGRFAFEAAWGRRAAEAEKV